MTHESEGGIVDGPHAARINTRGPSAGLGTRGRFRRWRERHEEVIAAWTFLFPGFLGWLVFIGLPTIAAFVLAFYRYNLLTPPKFVGLRNFEKLLRDDVFHAALINTVTFTVATVAASVVIGLVLAVLTDRALKGFVFLRSMLLLPYVVIMAGVAVVFRFIYLPDRGLIDGLLAMVGLDGPNWLTSEQWAMPALIILSVWKGFGYNMILFLAGLQNIPSNLYEAAEIDGASAWHRFWFITLPMLSPTMFFVIVISIIGSFQVFDQAYLMTNGGPGTATTTLVMYIYQLGFKNFDMGYASAVALVLFLVVFTFSMVQFAFQNKWVHYE
jgi:ABC-type sugar transport system permease subunit